MGDDPWNRKERRGIKDPALAQRPPEVVVAEYLERVFSGRRGINLGCGGMTFKDWLNIDQDQPWHLDIMCDLTKGLPFLPSGQFDAVFSEHFLEHIPRKAAMELLLDCHRALRPGGHIRISTPDLHKYVLAYNEGTVYPELRDAIIKEFGDLSGTRGELLNYLMRESGHVWIYTQEELDWLLCRAGFVEARPCIVRESSIPMLHDREDRPEGHSLITEATKAEMNHSRL
jgi:predicted SAM-dependent methyltransferase